MGPLWVLLFTIYGADGHVILKSEQHGFHSFEECFREGATIPVKNGAVRWTCTYEMGA
jgi:hypothetical protein